MPHETVTLFFALLASALALLSIALWASLLASAIGWRMFGRMGLVPTISDVALEFAAAIAITCTLGSLYLSEVAGFTPCRLCWVQRGFMYPAALVLLAALGLRRRRPSASRALAGIGGLLAAVGLPVAIFHRVEQAVGGIGDLCEAANPCSFQWVDHFGFVTIPTMSAVGFSGVFTLVALHLFWRRHD